MKIIIIGPSHPYRGGIAKFNEVLAENFVKAGCEVRIMNFTLQYPDLLFPGKSQYTSAPAPTGYAIERCLSSVNPFSWFATARRIREQQADLVVIRYWMPFFAPSLGSVARRLKCPVVALADNIVPHERHFYDVPCTKYFLGGVDAVVYMSRQVGEELERFNFGGLRAFSPHPIYDTYGEAVNKIEACRALELDPEVDYSLFFGFIRDYKGLDLLLEAWARMPEDTSHKRKLIVAGEYYGNRDKYEALIDELGLRERVIVRDEYIPENEVRYYFSAVDLVIQPYRTATQSGVTQVAYHFDVPMIVTSVGGLAEIVPNDRVGYVVEQSTQAIVSAIEDFYTRARAAEFRRNILTEKKRFEWNKMVETLLNLQRQIVK